MSEVTYGFVDADGILQNTAVFIDGDTVTLERVKEEFSAHAYYKMNLEKELALLGIAYWGGSRFLLPSPYPSWVFNEEINEWEAPVAKPAFDEEDPKYYTWDEATVSWVEVEVAP
jgi:hypothetical protein